MDSDFRLGLRSSFNNVKVKKDDSEQVIVEPTPTVEIVVPKKIIVEEKKETFIEPEKVKIDEKKEEIVQEVTEKTEFESMDLSEDELLEIKKLALKDIMETDLSVSELIDLVLLAKTGKTVKQKNFEPLVIREYVDMTGKMTKTGRMYLEFDEVKERLRKLIK